MKLFIELNMMQVFDDQTIYMTEVDKLIGSETNWARQKREQRLGVDNVHLLSTSCPPEIEKDKETEIDTDIEQERERESEEDPEYSLEDPEEALADLLESKRVKRLERIGGTLGQGVIFLTEEQDADLLDRLGYEGYNTYMQRLSDFIIRNNAKVKNHYATILKWYEEDTKV